MSKGSGGQRDEMGLKRFQQVRTVGCVVSFRERRLNSYLEGFKTLWDFLSYLFKISFFKWKWQ